MNKSVVPRPACHAIGVAVFSALTIGDQNLNLFTNLLLILLPSDLIHELE
jgi:hypothetical protein